MIHDLDAEATRLGTSRLHVLKTLLDGGRRAIRERDQKNDRLSACAPKA